MQRAGCCSRVPGGFVVGGALLKNLLIFTKWGSQKLKNQKNLIGVNF